MNVSTPPSQLPSSRGRRSPVRPTCSTVTDDAAIKLTTARYYTPLGRSIQAEGIIPDIKLENVSVTVENSSNGLSVKEKDLTGHLTNGNGDEKQEEGQEESGKETKADDPKGKKAGKEAKKQPLVAEDYALSEALNVLRALTIYKATAGSEAGKK